MSQASRAYTVEPLVGRPVTTAEVGVAELPPHTPRLPDPTPADPNQSWYAATPVPAVHVKVAVEPGRTVLGVGLVIAGRTAAPVPVSGIACVALVVELLTMVSWPVAVPEVEG
jgi:hypothetical protein